MPDWQELVRQRLAGLALDPAERDEIRAELAAHLEDAYEAMLRDGINNSEAAKRTLCLANDWQDLQRKISVARGGKDTMTNRVTQLWLPGLAAFVLSGGILALMQILRLKAWVLTKNGDLTAVLYVWWLILLPLIGAVGAYLSWRAGGSERAILLSIVFPVLPFLASILVVLPVSLIFDRFIAHNIGPMSLIFALFGWVLVPAAALLAGGLTTQHFLSRRSSVDGVASR
ncbi:MAG TPA: hypothetical protein VM709_08410 [Candidatus Sulfotelmatobacter sp.]|nr:hypothetical protein [Candidatus Sulfotelmatobacter sp.]